MRRYGIGAMLALAACGVDTGERMESWTIEESSEPPKVEMPEPPPGPPVVEPPPMVDPPEMPEPPGPPMVDPPGDEVAYSGLLVRQAPCPECRVTTMFYPIRELGGLVSNLNRGPGFISACQRDADVGVPETESWVVRWSEGSSEVFERDSRFLLRERLEPSETRVLMVHMKGRRDSSTSVVLDSIEPRLCETLQYTGVCLIPQPGDQCVVETGPGPDDGPISQVITTASATQRAIHYEAAFEIPRRIEWEGATTDFEVENGVAMRASFIWNGSFDPIYTNEEFIPFQAPEAEFPEFFAGRAGPLIDADPERLQVMEDHSWLAYQQFTGEVDQNFVSFGVLAGDGMPFSSSYLVWGALESKAQP